MNILPKGSSSTIIKAEGWPIEISGLHLRLDQRNILTNINARLNQSGCTVILGANGAGKTQFLRLIIGLEKPSQGWIKWNNKPTPPQDFAYVPTHSKPFNRSVLDNLLIGLKLKGIKGQNAKFIAHDALKLCQIEHLSQQNALILSSGERQKLFLARAWALKASTIFLDEPTANLDPASNASIELLISTLRAQGIQIILVTHNIAQAKRLADQVIFINAGYWCEQSPARDFFLAPSSPQAQSYLKEVAIG